MSNKIHLLENCMCVDCNKSTLRDMVHIHVHSDHSNLDGVNKIQNLVKKAKEFGHKSLVLNDHGNPSGIYSFYKECKKNGIKPILGLEFYVTNDLTKKIARKDRNTVEDNDYHQSVFIKNEIGYKNYNYLTYVSHTDGFYYKPRIDYDLLFSKKEGLMVTSSCIASKINQYLTAGKIADAEGLFKKFRDTFGDDFYAEIQLNELNAKEIYGINQKENNNYIINLARKFDVPILIGGDIHYTDPEDNELQDTVIRINQRVKEGEEGFKIHARSLYYTNSSDIFNFNKKFGFNYDEKFIHECLDNSLAFAEKPNFEFKTGKYYMPKINSSDSNMNSDELLQQLCYIKLAEKIKVEKKYFKSKWTEEYIKKVDERIKEELRVIKKLELSDYLLIVYDIINFERKNGIFVGPGRGCFLPNTEVSTPREKKHIQDVLVGDTVLNFYNEVSEVISTFVYEVSEEVVVLELESGKKIRCTKDHLFLKSNNEWVKAANLSTECSLKEIYKHYDKGVKIKNKSYEFYTGPVFDLEVSTSDKSYNVEGVVTHNSAVGSFCAYLLGIVGLDPIQHNLLFERFINEHRKVMCLTKDNMVLMKDGSSKTISELKISDGKDIKTQNNNELLMINVNDVNEDVYVISDEKGNVIEVTAEHIVPIIRNGKKTEVKAKNIKETDSFVTIKMNGSVRTD